MIEGVRMTKGYGAWLLRRLKNIRIWIIWICLALKVFEDQLFPNAGPAFSKGLMLAMSYAATFAFCRLGFSNRRWAIVYIGLPAVLLLILTIVTIRQL